MGTPANGTLGNGQAAFYEVDVAADQTLQVSFTTGTSTAFNELYVSFGTMPTRTAYEFAFPSAGADQQITVPTTQAGFYYILAYGSSVPSSGENYTITASLIPFAITGISPTQVGTGQATIEINGSKFDNGTTFKLLGPAGTIDEQSVDLQDSSTAFVTFNLSGMPTGSYDVQATQSDGSTIVLLQGLDVVPAASADVQVYLSAPNAVLVGAQGGISITYVNDGNTDALAPLMELTAEYAALPEAVLVGAGPAEQVGPIFAAAPLWFLGISSSGPAGVLRPGESGVINIPFQTTGLVGQYIDFDVQLADDSQPMDWASQESALQLPTIPNAAWPAVFANFVVNMGPTVATYHAALAADATYLGEIGEPTDNVLTLVSFELEKANAAFTTQTLDTVTDDSLPAPGMALTFQRSFQASIAGRYTEGLFGYGWTTNWDIWATTDSSGNAVITNDGGTLYYIKETDGSYQSEAGDDSVVTIANGAYRLVATDGTIYQFNPNGTIGYVQDFNGSRITAGYNFAGQLVSLTDSNGEYVGLSYNAQGHVSELTDSTGVTETFGYDPTGQFLTSATGVDGTTTYSYVGGQSAAADNALSEIAYANGTHTYFSFDSQGRLIDEHRDGGAQNVSYTYLAAGGYVTMDGDGNQTTTLFDTYGATAETIDALGNVTLYKYDSNLNLVEVDGPLGTKYTFTYDANGNLTRETDPLGDTTTFTYNSNNDLTSYTDANQHTTSYSYNSSNDLLSITYADGTTQQYTYNPLGEATSFLTADGDAIGYTYNAQGLVATETFADGTSYSYTYNAQGNMTSATDAQGNVETFIYGDSSNSDLLTEVEYPNGTWLKFSYNIVGQRTQSVDQTGFTVAYIYDSVGRLSELTDGSGNLIVQYFYDGAGNLIQKDNGNGTFTTYTYDADNDVLSITNYAPSTGSTSYDSANSAVNSFDDYTYGALGDVLTDTSQDGEWVYSYDADSQLVQAIFTPNSSDPDGLAAQNLQYVYDAVGNRISETVNGVTTTYQTNEVNEYTSSITDGVTTSYQYDPDGNLIAQTLGGSTTSYTYNELNELTAVNGPGMIASYGYDPLGHLDSQTLNGATTMFQVDPAGLGNVVAGYDGSGNLMAHYTYALGLVSQVNSSDDTAYYDFNVTGSTVGITNSRGEYIDQYSYLPFGEATTLSAALPNSFQFDAQNGVISVDDGSGVDVMGARDYDSSIAKFRQNDPSGLAGGDINLSRYCANDPINEVDPSGLQEDITGVTVQEDMGEFNPHAYTLPPDEYLQQVQNENDQLAVDQGAASAPSLGVVLNVIDFSWQVAEWFIPVLDDYKLAHTTFGLFKGIYELTHPEPGPDGKTPIVGDHDPNNIVGPAGFGPANIVPIDEILPYTIEFENEPTATAPAQQVVITDQLDPNLDWGAFRLGSFGFGGMTFQVPTNSAYYQTTIDLTQQFGYFVDVTATIDERTGIATWIFTTIDPASGNIPLDPTVGFLPPDNSSGAGEGFVSYTVMASQSDSTGTVINAQATVTFDNQPPLNTPQIFNTISALAPTVSISESPPDSNGTTTLSWSGQDPSNGPAIASYTVYMSENGGPYTTFLADTTTTQASFTLQPNEAYSFYVVADDNTGTVSAERDAASLACHSQSAGGAGAPGRR